MGKKTKYSPAWVMGGGKGLGLEIAKILTKQNSSVLVSSRSGIDKIALKEYDRICNLKGDLENYEDVLQHIDEFRGKGNEIEVIYYCVHRFFSPCYIEDMSWLSLEEQIAGCIRPFNNLIAAISEGRLNKLKSVVILTTSTVQSGGELFPHRNIAKSALESYMMYVAKTESLSKISFNGIALGYVETPQFKAYCERLSSMKRVGAINKGSVLPLSDAAAMCISIGHNQYKDFSGKIFQLDEI